MKKYIVLLLLLLFPAISWAASYYVDCGAAAGGDGSLATPWDAVADVNGASFSAGDYIYFKRGCTFREQLTVPSSGSSGSPITFGAYGSGAKPIINGSNLITPGTSWSAYVGSWSTSWSDEGVYTELDTGTVGSRSILRAADLSVSGTKIKITIKAHSASNITILGCSIGERSGTSDDFAAAPTRITFDNGNSGVTVSAGSNKVSDEITFTLDESKDYLIHFFLDNSARVVTYRSTAGGRYYDAENVDYTLTQNWTSDGSSANLYLINKLEVNAPTANVWQSAVTTEPNVVIFNGVLGNKKTAISELTSARDWFWADNVLYIYSTSDPDTAYTSPGIESGVRDYAFYITNKSYITVDGLALTGSNAYNGITVFANNAEINGITVQNSDLYSNYNCGFYTYIFGTGTITTVNILSNNVYYNGGAGIRAASCGTVLIQSNTVYENAKYYINADPDFDFNAGILAAGQNGTGCTNVTVESNTVYDNGLNAGNFAGVGIWFDGCPSSSSIIRYNLVYNCYRAGIIIGGSSAPRASEDIDVYYNIVHSNTRGTTPSGIRVLGGVGGVDSVGIYNNTIYGNTAGYRLLGSAADDLDVTAVLFKNNIVSGNTTAIVTSNEGAGNLFDYNCLGPEASNFISYKGSNYSTYDAWETAYGGTTNSVEADPQLISSTNFRIKGSSPARRAGADLNLTTDFAGRPVINYAAALASGSVTKANMRMSIVNGTAFVDFSSAGSLTPYLNGYLTITDSAGKKLKGYIKAAGTGETLGSELLPNTAFDNTTNVEVANATVASVAGGQSGNCLETTGTGATPYSKETYSGGSSGKLYKYSVYCKKGTADGQYLNAGQWDGSTWTDFVGEYVSDVAWTNHTYYYTSRPGGQDLVSTWGTENTKTILTDTVSLKQTLTPSATGATIVSSRYGTTYNWESEESGFNRNDTSGYTYTITGYNVDIGAYQFSGGKKPMRFGGKWR